MRPRLCPLCGEALPTWAYFDWHRQMEHDRTDEPCDLCGQWNDERTGFGPFGWAHLSCEAQKAEQEAS